MVAAAGPRGGGDSPLLSARVASGRQLYLLEDLVKVGGPLGSGSFGQVTKVVHKKTAEIYAMKVIPKAKVEEFEMDSYLEREIKTQLQVQHPNILRLYQAFEEEDSVHLLLEYANGGSLFGVLRKRGKLPEPEAARHFADVAAALDYLHSLGVVHRDLKPENILMCGDSVKLADFGWCTEGRASALRTTFCGTLDYLSPEMVRDEPHDWTVDIWAVGVLLYELLTGKSPWEADNQMNSLMRITKCDLQIPPEISEPAGDLISKLLVDDRTKRLMLCKAITHRWVVQYYIIDDSKLKTRKSVDSVNSVVAAAAEAERQQSKRIVPDDDANEECVGKTKSELAMEENDRRLEAALAALKAEEEEEAGDLKASSPTGDAEEDEMARRAEEAIKAAEAAAAVEEAELAAAEAAEAARAAAAAPAAAGAQVEARSANRAAAAAEAESPNSWQHTDAFRKVQTFTSQMDDSKDAGCRVMPQTARAPRVAKEQATEIAMPNSARTMPNSARDGASWNQSDEFRKLHSWLRDQRQNHIDERYPELGEELDSLMKLGQKTSVQKREGPQSGPSGGHVGPSSSGKKTRRKGHASSKKGAKLRLLSPQVQYSKPSPEFLAVKAWVVEEQIRTGRSNFGVVTGAPPPRAGLAQTPTGSLTKTPLGTARSIGSMISSCSSDSGDCMPTTDKIGQTTPLVSKSAQAAQSIPVLPLATATANL